MNRFLLCGEQNENGVANPNPTVVRTYGQTSADDSSLNGSMLMDCVSTDVSMNNTSTPVRPNCNNVSQNTPGAMGGKFVFILYKFNTSKRISINFPDVKIVKLLRKS